MPRKPRKFTFTKLWGETALRTDTKEGWTTFIPNWKLWKKMK